MGPRCVLQNSLLGLVRVCTLWWPGCVCVCVFVHVRVRAVVWVRVCLILPYCRLFVKKNARNSILWVVAWSCVCACTRVVWVRVCLLLAYH